jgi:hypothetical protein
MAQIIRTKPGVVTAQDGTYPELRGARKGGLVSQDVGGRYEEGAYRGVIFTAAQTAGTAAIALAAGGATLQLFNPNNSKVNLSILDITVCLEAQTGLLQQVAVQLGGAATGATQTLTTPLTTNSSLVGSKYTSQGVALVSSTFSNTAIALRYLASYGQLATGTSTGIPAILNSVKDEIAGAIMIPPGSYVGVYALTGGTVGDITFSNSITWEEIPL